MSESVNPISTPGPQPVTPVVLGAPSADATVGSNFDPTSTATQPAEPADSVSLNSASFNVNNFFVNTYHFIESALRDALQTLSSAPAATSPPASATTTPAPIASTNSANPGGSPSVPVPPTSPDTSNPISKIMADLEQLGKDDPAAKIDFAWNGNTLGSLSVSDPGSSYVAPSTSPAASPSTSANSATSSAATSSANNASNNASASATKSDKASATSSNQDSSSSSSSDSSAKSSTSNTQACVTDQSTTSKPGTGTDQAQKAPANANQDAMTVINEYNADVKLVQSAPSGQSTQSNGDRWDVSTNGDSKTLDITASDGSKKVMTLNTNGSLEVKSSSSTSETGATKDDDVTYTLGGNDSTFMTKTDVYKAQGGIAQNMSQKTTTIAINNDGSTDTSDGLGGKPVHAPPASSSSSTSSPSSTGDALDEQTIIARVYDQKETVEQGTADLAKVAPNDHLTVTLKDGKIDSLSITHGVPNYTDEGKLLGDFEAGKMTLSDAQAALGKLDPTAKLSATYNPDGSMKSASINHDSASSPSGSTGDTSKGSTSSKDDDDDNHHKTSSSGSTSSGANADKSKTGSSGSTSSDANADKSKTGSSGSTSSDANADKSKTSSSGSTSTDANADKSKTGSASSKNKTDASTSGSSSSSNSGSSSSNSDSSGSSTSAPAIPKNNAEAAAAGIFAEVTGSYLTDQNLLTQLGNRLRQDAMGHRHHHGRGIPAAMADLKHYIAKNYGNASGA